MATITKNGLTIMALLASLYILETGRFIPVGVGRGRVEPEDHHGGQPDHHRDKRNAAAAAAAAQQQQQQHFDYTIHLTINTYNSSLLASFVNTAQLPIQLDNQTQISDINISAQCYPHGSGFQCVCWGVTAWPNSTCLQYGSCNVGSFGLCQCINAIPADGQSCVPVAELPQFEYQVEVELNVTDVAAVEDVKTLLGSISFPLSVRPYVSLTSVEVTTVCSPGAGAFQCRCEDGFSWSQQQCAALGACDGTSAGGAPCQCINNIPPDGPFCQPSMANYQYLISLELVVDDVDLLREVLANISFPVVTQALTVSDLNISTVCSPSAGGFRCRCEDQYVWPCADCLQYGACDNRSHGLCSCIHAIPPDGRHCLPLHHGLLPCPSSTEAPPSTAAPLLHQYVLSVEVRVPEVSGVNQLRGILGNASYPISIGNNTQISEVNITAVCEELSGELQCRCEGQQRWRCELCGALGSCDVIGGGGGGCGCLSGRPPSGEQCQPQERLSSCRFLITTTDSSPATSAAPTATTTPAITDTSSAATTHLNTDTHTTPVSSPGPSATSVSPSNQTAATPTAAVATTTESARPSTQATTLITSTSVSTTYVTMTSNTTTGAASATGSTTVWTTGQTTTTTVTGPSTAASTLVTPTPSAPVASTTAVTTTQPTPSTTTSAAPSTSALTSSTGRTAIPSSTPFAGFSIEMSIRLAKDFTDDFDNPSSAEYMELKKNVSEVLNEQYKVITGFVEVYVERFRRGSILTDFVLNSRQVNAIELAAVNQQLPAAMEPVAKVIGSVTVLYNSKESIGVPALTYTGSNMTLTCGPRSEDIHLGRVSSSLWRYQGRDIPESNRIKVTTSDTGSKLSINDVIPQDAGRYTCILSANMTFIQEGNVREENIEQAPNLQLQSRVNAQCRGALTQELKCCVQAQYKVQWFEETGVLLSFTVNVIQNQTYCITHTYKLENCTDVPRAETFTCRVVSPDSYYNTTTLVIFTDDHTCDDSQFGIGRRGDISEIACGKGQEGSKRAICEIVDGTGHWKLEEDTCILIAIKDLLIDSEDLIEEEVPALALNLSQTVETQKENVTDSSQTISAIVEILNSIANVSTNVTEGVMGNVLDTVDVIIANSAKDSWDFLNANETRNDSSVLLGALESLTDGLEGKVLITKERIQLNRTSFNHSFDANLNSSVFIQIADSDLTNVFITTMMLSTFNNVMPARNSTFNISALDAGGGQTDGSNAINAATVLIKVTENIHDITLRYRKLDSSLTDDPQCVFWNFTLLDNLGAWDDQGCTFVSDRNNVVTCTCNHLTSFSILMATNVPPAIRVLLDVITYVGVGISMASLLICLAIEGYVWKAMTRNSTAFMRHVSIVNTALSLLIADICFIIAASYAKNPLENPGEDHRVPLGPCSTATFFMHFFYLAVFFWMLVSGLLLFYRTVMVFSHMSKSSMLAAGFTLGYGCPLLIAVITVAVTASQGGYIRTSEACWLNWNQTRALLAFVIPALTVVFVNILIIAVVLFKMLRRGVGEMAQTDERHTLVVIARCVLILTPLFGLTWSLGVGTMVSSTNRGIHIAFAFFNSLQGFFILVFGTLWDSKIRSALSRKFQPTSSTGSNPTKSTSAGISSIGQLNFISRLRGRRYVYHLSEAANSSSSSLGTSDTYANI